ncbi:thiol-activated cytolysin family protein [Embleya sp. NPDC005971]|uniref:thiol-activated cytolysin family protein n=1 Tax=Embleya sp. NPDC005971 TaxID=3156724 RepID=UPI00340E50A0
MTATRQDPDEATTVGAGEIPAPAWGVDLGEGRWAVEWDVPGAVRYELHRVEDAPERDRERTRTVAEASDPGGLTFAEDGTPGVGRYVVVAFADQDGLPVGISAVGFGSRSGKADIAAQLGKWRQWSSLCPHKPDAKTKVGSPQVDTVKGVKRTKQTYTLTKNPDMAITFNPNASTCFPGAIVQARPAIEHGYLVPAQIEDADRADLAITVDRMTGRKETVSPPSASNVTAAIARVVGETEASPNITYNSKAAYSSAEVALELGVSATYGGFAASLDVDAKRKETKNTFMVFLREVAFTAFCDTSTPEALFKDGFTQDKITRLVNLGHMGPDNPPLLVNSVVYGRILMFSMTSKSSETEINAALNASYSGFANMSASVKAHFKEVFTNSEISIVGVSVEPEMIKELLSEGTLKEYFSTHQKLKTYGRIGYTLQTLDGTPAKMSETTTYDAVVWGDAGNVTLEVTGFAGAGFVTTKGVYVVLDGTRLELPASKSRSFDEGGSGEPFKITRIEMAISKPIKVDCALGPKELGWFHNGPVTEGRYTIPSGGPKMELVYTATQA